MMYVALFKLKIFISPRQRDLHTKEIQYVGPCALEKGQCSANQPIVPCQNWHTCGAIHMSSCHHLALISCQIWKF